MAVNMTFIKIFTQMKKTKLFLFCLALICVPIAARAVTLNLTNIVDMDFGDVEFTAGATGSVQMGTNGAVTYTGSFTGDGVGIAGSFLLNTSAGNGTVFQIACDATAIMRNGAASLTMNYIEYVVGTANRTSFGGGTQCGGLSITVNFTRNTGAANRTVYIGGRINIPSTPTSGTYATSNAGGNDIAFTAIIL